MVTRKITGIRTLQRAPVSNGNDGTPVKGYEILLSCHDEHLESWTENVSIWIEDVRQCCEKYDCLMSSGSGRFVGAVLLDVVVSNGGGYDDMFTADFWDAENTENSDSVMLHESGTFVRKTMFVDVYTSQGILRFGIYNVHNGTGEHEAVVDWNGRMSYRVKL